MIAAVSQWLNLPNARTWQGKNELDAYINANPRQRSSLGTTSKQIEELMSNNMPPETKVQSFSNRLPGGISAEPKRQADSMTSLAYQLMAVGASFPAASKREPLYLHFSLPKSSSPELLRFWRLFLEEKAAIGEGGTVTIDELKFYKVDNEQLIYKPRSIDEFGIEFKLNKVVGLAFPKRPEFIQSTVIIPILWGDVNNSIALLKTIHLALELSLAADFGFPFVVSSNLEVESWNDFYGRVEGIPSALQPLLGNGQYRRLGHSKPKTLKPEEIAEKILTRLRCLGKLAITIASLPKKDDCLYDLARSLRRPLELYYVILRWILREHDDPNLEYFWNQISQPLNILLESCMKDEHDLLSRYLKEAARIATEAKIWGNVRRRTGRLEPFKAFTSAIRTQKNHVDIDTVFAYLIEDYHARLNRIREGGVGKTKLEKLKEYYGVLQALYHDVYNNNSQKFLSDSKLLESAYLFFIAEANQNSKVDENNDDTLSDEN
jgi:CRISPR-associated protein Csc3